MILPSGGYQFINHDILYLSFITHTFLYNQYLKHSVVNYSL